MKGHSRSDKLKDGTEQWAAVFYPGKRFGRDGKIRDGYRWIRGFRTERAADTELRRILTTVDNETSVQPSKQNLADYLEYWLNAAKLNLAPKIFERYKQLVDINIKPKLGLIKLGKLQPSQLAEFYAWSGRVRQLSHRRGVKPTDRAPHSSIATEGAAAGRHLADPRHKSG